MKTTQPSTWMNHEQAAAYLNCTSGALKELVCTEGIPKHYLFECSILYNRAEFDDWLMNC